MTREKEGPAVKEEEGLKLTERAARKRLELLFSDSTDEDYPFTAWFAEAVRTAIKVLAREEKRKKKAARRKGEADR